MKITIIGWYGTETIGDRAILAGILMSLVKVYDNFEIQLGSLYPFYTKRTLKEDSKLFQELTKKKITISIFNSKLFWELDRAIDQSDLVLVGGGPLMHIEPLYMLEYAFKLAKKKNKKTAILGCGIGPLFTKKYKKSVINIINNSDLVILRDSISKKNLNKIFKEFRTTFNSNKIKVSCDPSLFACVGFLKNNKKNKDQNYIAINLREFPAKYSEPKIIELINKHILEFIGDLIKKFKDKKIRLIPMHYFHVGNDDRVFLNKIKNHYPEYKNVQVQQKPLNLKETMDIFFNAKINIGMRFHSVVLQTMLSGKNYVFDYTEPKIGKISGFLTDIDKNNFYKKRYLNLQSQKLNLNLLRNTSKSFAFNRQQIKNKFKIYTQGLLELL